MIPSDIKHHLSYDPETGVFTCIKRYANKVRIGAEVGCVMPIGYVCLTFRGRKYYAHRLAWWWVHGDLPARIDHINGVPHDNRISNLRPATHAQNIANAGRRKASGFKGVYLHRDKKRWQAKIKVQYRPIYLGLFETEVEAARAYDAAALEHFGAYARLNFPERMAA